MTRNTQQDAFSHHVWQRFCLALVCGLIALVMLYEIKLTTRFGFGLIYFAFCIGFALMGIVLVLSTGSRTVHRKLMSFLSGPRAKKEGELVDMPKTQIIGGSGYRLAAVSDTPPVGVTALRRGSGPSAA
jgi:hypothetical protein